MRLWLAALIAITSLIGPAVAPAQAASGDRTLHLYYTHTKESGSFTFRKNGRYDQKVLAELNVFLRDWRRNEPAKMDPALFDLIWQVYQDVGASQPITIVSAYRSPATNEMLRKTSSGVAENSQHTKGHAMDFYIPGVPLATLRAAAMKRQVGGVGYYPTSGSPFVHLDVGSVRAWPRMTRSQLAKVFPDGRTLHLPAEGKPLSEEGRQYAQAQWQQCRMVPCNGGGGSNTRLASNDTSRGGPNLFDRLFGGKEEPRQQQAAPVAVANVDVQRANAPTQRQVQTVAVAPVPAARPADMTADSVQTASIEPSQPANIPFSTVGSAPLEETATASMDAPVPAVRSAALLASMQAATAPGESAVMAIAALDPPVPAVRPTELASAYAPAAPEPGAQEALQAIIARQGAVPTSLVPTPRTASLGRAPAAAATGNLASLMDATWGAVEQAEPDNGMAAALAAKAAQMPMRTLSARAIELAPPDLEHVGDTMVAPVLLSSTHFADIGEAGEGDFDPKTQLGAYARQVGFVTGPDAIAADRFTTSAPALRGL